MKLVTISVTNYRCFSDLTVDLREDSVYLVGANSVGKTTVLEAIRLALHGGTVDASDFHSLGDQMEVVVTIAGIPPAHQSRFAEALDFSESPPVLRVGFRSNWNDEEAEPESTHGFPDDGWKRVGRLAREALPLLVFPAWRDPARLTSVVGRSSLLAELLKALALEGELDQAVQDVTAVGEALGAATPVQELMNNAGAEIERFLPIVAEDPFSLKNAGTRPEDTLKQLELYLESQGADIALSRQSAGLAQAAVFALLLLKLAAAPGSVVLIDEPEIALHPQAQRALADTLRASSGQCVVATHSAAVLDSVDPREVVRIKRVAGQGTAVRASALTDDEARTLSRYSTSQTAEAFFAESIIIVEGFSDLLAVRRSADVTGRNLDGAGVSVLSLDGAGTIKHYLRLFGPQGLDLDLHGLCDEDAEADWIAKLTDAGIAVATRTDLEGHGFYVCDPDLEFELVAALGSTGVKQVVAEHGAEGTYNSFANQSSNSGKSEIEVQVAFFKRDKVRWAPLLSDALKPTSVPSPIADLLGSV
jgi:predicted ATPase